jgi:predicted GH43/DUF377 family glycosyl hydrolase
MLRRVLTLLLLSVLLILPAFQPYISTVLAAPAAAAPLQSSPAENHPEQPVIAQNSGSTRQTQNEPSSLSQLLATVRNVLFPLPSAAVLAFRNSGTAPLVSDPTFGLDVVGSTSYPTAKTVTSYGAGITYDRAVGNSGTGTGGSGESQSLTTAAANELVVISITSQGSTGPSSVTVGGSAATSLTSATQGTDVRLDLYYFFEATAGSHSVSVSWASSTRHAWDAVAYQNVATSSPYFDSGSTNTNTGSGLSQQTASVLVAAGTTGRMIIQAVAATDPNNGSGSISISVSSPQTERSENDQTGGTSSRSDSDEVNDYLTDAATTMSATLSKTGTPTRTIAWATIGASIIPGGTAASIDTSQSEFGGASAKFVASASQYLSIPDSSDWYFSGDFTIDTWVRFSTLPTSGNSMYFFGQYASSSAYMRFGLSYSSGQYQWLTRSRVSTGDTRWDASWTTTVATNTWYHVAFVRSGNTLYCFQNGAILSGTGTSAGAGYDYSSPAYVGQYGNDGSYLNGWLDELRVTNGLARWTSAFVPPAARYDRDSYTVLLLHMDPSGFLDDVTTGQAKATKATLLDNGASVSSVSFYSHAAGNVRLAIYSDSSGPSSKLCEVGDTAVAASAWTAAPISGCGTLSAGTYWLVWQWNPGAAYAAGPSYTAGSSGDGNYIYMSYGSFPASWPGGTSSSEKWSIYASYTSGISTMTSLDSISTPLTTSQAGVAFSGSVTPTSVPNDINVELRYASTCLLGSGGTVAQTATTSGGNGGYLGTFTAPSVADTYQFWAYFVGGSGYGSSSSTCQSITVNAAGTYSLTVSANPTGSGTFGLNPPGGSYASGQVVQVTPTASAGYYFIGWALDGVFDGYDNPLSVTMDANHALTGYFQSKSTLWPKYSTSEYGYLLGPSTGTWDAFAVYGGRPFTLQASTSQSPPWSTFCGGQPCKFGMIYTGDTEDNGVGRAIGLAASVDGFTWYKYPTQILQAGSTGSWDIRIANGQVIWDGTQYVMYYTGRSTSALGQPIDAVGRATSTDLINWVKDTNPVLTGLYSSEGTGPVHPLVIKMGPNAYTMWYTAPHPDNDISRIFIATSTDGISWTREAGGQTVFTPSSDPTAWDAGLVYFEAVIYNANSGTYTMFYSGCALPQEGTICRIGFATSPNGIDWTRAPTNPIVAQSPADSTWPASWNIHAIKDPGVAVFNGRIMLYYTGDDYAMGLAMEPVATSISPAGPYAAGVTVTDTATVVGSGTELFQPSPTGTVDFHFYSTGDCTGTSSDETGVALVSGSATSSSHGPLAAGPYSFKAHYNGDANNNPADSSCEVLTVGSLASPTISTTLSSTSISVGGSVHDSATLASATSDAGGTVTYYYYSDSGCSTGQTQVGSPVTVTNGVVPNSADQTFNTAGSFGWKAHYSGDANNNPADSSCEVLTVTSLATPTVSTLIQPSDSVQAGSSVTDVATVSGGSSPTGTVDFHFYSTGDCTGTSSDETGVALVSGSATSSSHGPLAAGPYSFKAHYNGDANNNPADSSCELLTVAAPTYGMLRVYSDPAVQTTIFVNNLPRDDWGLNWVKLAPGQYVVHFSDVPGFATPPNQTVMVTAGQTTTVVGTFVQLGYVHVITNPAVAGTISIDGAARDDWGAWLALTPGSHTVHFGDVADFATPADQQVNVVAGTTVDVTGNYVSGVNPGPTGFGELRVVTSPAVISTISMNNVPMDDWGLNWVKLAPDNYMLSLSDVPGWAKPTQVEVKVYAFGSLTPESDNMVNYLTDPIPISADKVTEVTAIFTQLGYLHVVTNPAVAGTIYINGVAVDDWGCWTPLAPGSYTVHFGDVPGFTTPPDQVVDVTAGTTTPVTGNYT